MAKLAPVQNQGLRICLNAFRTTNAASLHVDTVQELFTKVPTANIIAFLKEINRR